MLGSTFFYFPFLVVLFVLHKDIIKNVKKQLSQKEEFKRGGGPATLHHKFRYMQPPTTTHLSFQGPDYIRYLDSALGSDLVTSPHHDFPSIKHVEPPPSLKF